MFRVNSWALCAILFACSSVSYADIVGNSESATDFDLPLEAVPLSIDVMPQPARQNTDTLFDLHVSTTRPANLHSAGTIGLLADAVSGLESGSTEVRPLAASSARDGTDPFRQSLMIAGPHFAPATALVVLTAMAWLAMRRNRRKFLIRVP